MNKKIKHIQDYLAKHNYKLVKSEFGVWVVMPPVKVSYHWSSFESEKQMLDVLGTDEKIDKYIAKYEAPKEPVNEYMQAYREAFVLPKK